MEIINSRIFEANQSLKDLGVITEDQKLAATQNVKNVVIKVLNLRVNGVETPTTCVEFDVIGKRNGRVWQDFLTLDEFAKHNPEKLEKLLNNN